MHYYEVGNKIWLTKYGRRPVVGKSTKKVLYAIFFSCDGIGIDVRVS